MITTGKQSGEEYPISIHEGGCYDAVHGNNYLISFYCTGFVFSFHKKSEFILTFRSSF